MLCCCLAGTLQIELSSPYLPTQNHLLTSMKYSRPACIRGCQLDDTGPQAILKRPKVDHMWSRLRLPSVLVCRQRHLAQQSHRPCYHACTPKRKQMSRHKFTNLTILGTSYLPNRGHLRARNPRIDTL
jgi:hypothetical protein